MKKVISIKDWLEKERFVKEQIKETLDMERISWFKLIQLGQ